jgi:hypothetical protein
MHNEYCDVKEARKYVTRYFIQSIFFANYYQFKLDVINNMSNSKFINSGS